MAHYEPGTYTCRIKRAFLGESRQKKTPYVALEFTPVQGPNGPVSQPYDRNVEMYLTEKTKAFQLERLYGLGWPGGSFSSIPNHDFSGREVTLLCSHDQNGTGVYEKWDFPREGGSSNQAGNGADAAEAARKLDTLFGKDVRQPAQQPVAAGVDGQDDIPF